MSSSSSDSEQKWGRVLICGGTHWATNGSKDRGKERATDLHTPAVLRSLCDIKITKLITGSHANYAIVLDIRGKAHLFGKSPAWALGANTNGIISEQAPLKISPYLLGADRGVKFVDGAAGKTHALLVDNEGGVWGCGNNVAGQLGLPTCSEVSDFTRISGPWGDAKIVQVTAGNTFSLFLTESGEVYASGSSQNGQLGNDKTGERLVKHHQLVYDLETPPRQIQGLKGKKIVKIASGGQHSLAMEEEGYVWTWGCAGYARLGLGDQRDRLAPTVVPNFTGHESSRAASITCGPTNSIVIDRTGTYYLAGKWATSGDGSAGQAWTSFRLVPDIRSYNISKASSGGCTHFALATEEGENGQVIGWGQGVLYGELGLGDDESSSKKPVSIKPLEDIDIIDVAGGAFFSLFLARPSEAVSSLSRYPEHIDSSTLCLECNRATEEEMLECEKCDEPYHPKCLNPPLDGLPEGEWFCPECIREQEEQEKEDENESRETSVGSRKRGRSDERSRKGSSPRKRR